MARPLIRFKDPGYPQWDDQLMLAEAVRRSLKDEVMPPVTSKLQMRLPTRAIELPQGIPMEKQPRMAPMPNLIHPFPNQEESNQDPNRRRGII